MDEMVADMLGVQTLSDLLVTGASAKIATKSGSYGEMPQRIFYRYCLGTPDHAIVKEGMDCHEQYRPPQGHFRQRLIRDIKRYKFILSAGLFMP